MDGIHSSRVWKTLLSFGYTSLMPMSLIKILTNAYANTNLWGITLFTGHNCGYLNYERPAVSSEFSEVHGDSSQFTEGRSGRTTLILYRRFWESGEIPTDWKLANTIPIYKMSIIKDPGNDQPIKSNLNSWKNYRDHTEC